jgi:hypothetical protein
VMTFIEGELFHVKRTNLSVYERVPVDFIFTESWWHLLNGRSSTIRDWTWPFTKSSLPILFTLSHYIIYWRGALPRQENEIEILRKASINFIFTNSWWYLLKWCSSTLRDPTWPFKKSCASILLQLSRDEIYWMEGLTR